MPEVCLSGQWYRIPHDPEAAAWGRQPDQPPPPRRRSHRWRPLGWYDYCCWYVIVFGVRKIALELSAPAPSTALALLPTCPAPVPDPPLCFDWEKPAAATVQLGSGSADSNWRRDGRQGGDYNVAKQCFDNLLRDAAWTCDEQEDDYKAAAKCFDSLVRDATRICFVWSYDDTTPLTRQSGDPPPTSLVRSKWLRSAIDILTSTIGRAQPIMQVA